MTVKATAMSSNSSSPPHGSTFAALQILFFLSHPLDAKPLDDDAAALIGEVAALLNERERKEAESTLLFNSTCHRCHWFQGRVLDGCVLDGVCTAIPWMKGERVVSYNDSCPDFTTSEQWLLKQKEDRE